MIVTVGWKIVKEKLYDFFKESKQFTIILIDKKKIWLAVLLTIIVCISLIFFQDGVLLWKKANIDTPIMEEKIVSADIGQDIRDEIAITEKEPKEPVLIDLSSDYIKLDTTMQRINEPIFFNDEIIYSAGEGDNIEDGAILTKLYICNMEDREERVIAESRIKFGEIYEGRLSEDWIAWLDTNHVGTNIIYGMNRDTGEVFEIKRCEYNRPQLRLWGENLVWVEQRDLENDSLYLYNFSSGEPVVLESFSNSTYGTCPPSIWNDVVVWTSPGEGGGSVIKKLDLKKIDRSSEEEPKLELIDPKGFAIYPSTNGSTIAWLDNLDPQKASLKLTLDGKDIITVATGIGRFFGVGDKFVAYTQEGKIMLYFWEEGQYAHINPKDTQGRLSQCSVSGNHITWYSNPPRESQDIVNVTIIK